MLESSEPTSYHPDQDGNSGGSIIASLRRVAPLPIWGILAIFLSLSVMCLLDAAAYIVEGEMVDALHHIALAIISGLPAWSVFRRCRRCADILACFWSVIAFFVLIGWGSGLPRGGVSLFSFMTSSAFVILFAASPILLLYLLNRGISRKWFLQGIPDIDVTISGGNAVRTVHLGDTAKLKLVKIPGGQFIAGNALSPGKNVRKSNGNQVSYGDEHPQNEVQFLESFYMSETCVTQKQYHLVMGHNPAKFGGDERPVERVSWHDAVQFCKQLSRELGETFQLPAEAQWEYACRAGSTTAYCFGDSQKQLGRYVWYGENSGSRTHPVGQKKPNAWGLYDMHGNVWEWCADCYDSGCYEDNMSTDQKGPTTGSYRVLRGGSWGSDADDVRSANRYDSDPTNAGNHYGFRVVLCVSSPE